MKAQTWAIGPGRGRARRYALGCPSRKEKMLKKKRLVAVSGAVLASLLAGCSQGETSPADTTVTDRPEGTRRRSCQPFRPSPRPGVTSSQTANGTTRTAARRVFADRSVEWLRPCYNRSVCEAGPNSREFVRLMFPRAETSSPALTTGQC